MIEVVKEEKRVGQNFIKNEKDASITLEIENQEVKKSIMHFLEKSLDYLKDKKINITIIQENNYWQSEIIENGDKKVEVETRRLIDNVNILQKVLKWIYFDLSKSRLTTIIEKNELGYIASIKNKEYYHENLESILKIIRKKAIKNHLMEEPIVRLITPGDMYEQGFYALESTLMSQKTQAISCIENQELTTIIEEANWYTNTYEIDQKIINKKEYPELWNILEKNNYILHMSLIDELYFKSSLKEKETGNIIEESIANRAKESLNELEFKLQNNLKRKKEKGETKYA